MICRNSKLNRLPNAFITAILVLIAFGGNAIAQGYPLDIERLPLYSLTLKVHTCDVKYAGTDGDFYVVMANKGTPGFWLDNPGDDRKRNGWDEYSVPLYDLANIGDLDEAFTVKDIERLFIGTHSNDGWCIDRVYLKVNDSPYTLFYNGPGNYWIDNNGAHRYINYSGSQLREYTGWSNYYVNEKHCDLPPQIQSTTLVNLLEGMIGNELASDGDASWGDGYVKLSRRDSDTINAKIKVHYDYDCGAFCDVFGDVPVDATVSFRINASCNNGEINLGTSHSDVEADLPWYVDLLDILTLGIISYIADDEAQDAIPEMSGAITENIGYCPGMSFDSGANLNLDWDGYDTSFPGAMCIDAEWLKPICTWIGNNHPLCTGL
ncbi:MAG: hypothetical protein GY847_21820 [Proteobacteria bacterium]|nr:hypothetical protein [Pseudomonadota bacterium]